MPTLGGFRPGTSLDSNRMTNLLLREHANTNPSMSNFYKADNQHDINTIDYGISSVGDGKQKSYMNINSADDRETKDYKEENPENNQRN